MTCSEWLINLGRTDAYNSLPADSVPFFTISSMLCRIAFGWAVIGIKFFEITVPKAAVAKRQSTCLELKWMGSSRHFQIKGRIHDGLHKYQYIKPPVPEELTCYFQIHFISEGFKRYFLCAILVECMQQSIVKRNIKVNSETACFSAVLFCNLFAVFSFLFLFCILSDRNFFLIG